MLERMMIIAMVTLGYCCIFWEGMIFERVGDWLECNISKWLWYPLGGCYICACMWVGSIAYILLYAHVAPGVWKMNGLDWFLTCVGAMGINAVISQFVDKRHKVEITDMPPVKPCNYCGETPEPDNTFPKRPLYKNDL